MEIRALGSAAGGGFPQWNCACRNCSGARLGTLPAKSRTQAQLAVSGDGKAWYLLGASPDLRAQIEATPELQSRDGIRQSPIAGVVLANADLDHVLGLLLLRELQPLRIYATPSVQRIVRDGNHFFRMLNRTHPQAIWSEYLPGKPFRLCSPQAEDSGITVEAVPLGEHYPAYVEKEQKQKLLPQESSVGLILSNGEKSVGYFPAVPALDAALLEKLDAVDLLFFDGTFWSDDELTRIQGSGANARQMGHIPIGSHDGSLHQLAGLRKPRKIFTHVNNTNPILDESSSERRQVHDAHWEVAEDGWRFTL